MADETLGRSLQESLLTLICMDDTKGGIAANLVDTELFEPPYDRIALRAIEYRKRYKEAPGSAHLDDLFDDILGDTKNKQHRIYQQVLGGIIEQAENLNADYTLSRVTEFMRRQNLKASILEAAERFQQGGDGVLSDAENILHKALRFEPDSLDRGMYLSDKKGIEFLTQYSVPDFRTGILELDKRGIGLTRGETFGFMASKGRGKTWKCINIGVMCLLQGAKVLHISLEMKDQRVIPRYLRRMFAIAKTDERYRTTKFQFDDMNRVIGFRSRLGKASLNLRDPKIERKVAEKMDRLGVRLDRLHFKSFPTSQLTMGQLIAYMDNLEASDGFVPDVIILDYPKLMKLDRRVGDVRLALGLRMEELRGLCDERHMAGFFPFQGNRAGEAEEMTAANIGEDYSLTQTVDNFIIYNQTRAERALGLARLYVDKARSEKDDFSVLITQDYETGQFCKQSAYMPNSYFSMLKGKGEDNDNETEERGESKARRRQ